MVNASRLQYNISDGLVDNDEIADVLDVRKRRRPQAIAGHRLAAAAYHQAPSASMTFSYHQRAHESNLPGARRH